MKFHFTERDSCSIQITKKQIPKNEPVYLTGQANGHLKLYEPTSNSIEIESNDKLILFCPGRRNTLAQSGENSNELSCANNFRSKLHQSNCTKQVTGDLETTTKPCRLNERQGLIYRAGFDVERKFVELYEICFDAESASVIYTHHHINGKAIRCKRILDFLGFAVKEFRSHSFFLFVCSLISLRNI